MVDSMMSKILILFFAERLSAPTGAIEKKKKGD
jgi:hypothetical protein